MICLFILRHPVEALRFTCNQLDLLFYELLVGQEYDSSSVAVVGSLFHMTIVFRDAKKHFECTIELRLQAEYR